MALRFAAIFALVQIVLGDLQGLAVLDHQPTKLAAIEANRETQRGVPLVLFAWPDQEAQESHWKIAIPRLGSLILAHDPDGEIPDLRDVPRGRQPPVLPVFLSFRMMVSPRLLMLGVAAWSLWLRWKRRLLERSAFLWPCFAMTPSGLTAGVFGWFTAEIGHQP